MKAFTCEDCRDSGFYGDNGPGIAGNSEYQICECVSAARKLMEKTQAETRIKQNKEWRQKLDAILQEMKDASHPFQPGATPESAVPNPKYTGVSRHRLRSIEHLEDSIMRLGMDMKEVNEAVPGAAPNPYPESYNPANAVVESTADGIRL